MHAQLGLLRGLAFHPGRVPTRLTWPAEPAPAAPHPGPPAYQRQQPDLSESERVGLALSRLPTARQGGRAPPRL